MLEKLYKKFVIGETVTLENIINYVELAAKAINPNVLYTPNYTMLLVHSGMGEILINLVTNAIETNAEKVGFQVIKVYSPEKVLLKTITKKLKC